MGRRGRQYGEEAVRGGGRRRRPYGEKAGGGGLKEEAGVVIVVVVAVVAVPLMVVVAVVMATTATTTTITATTTTAIDSPSYSCSKNYLRAQEALVSVSLVVWCPHGYSIPTPLAQQGPSDFGMPAVTSWHT